MLTLLKIKNIALIDELTLEFGEGLNLLTGETGSGKSIIVDSLGALTGERVSSDLIKEGAASAIIDGLFTIEPSDTLSALLDEAGIEADDDELIVRRELSAAGKNRVFINGQLVTQGFLKKVGIFLVDIHGQGEQTALFDVGTHIGMLDEFAPISDDMAAVSEAYNEWTSLRDELAGLEQDASERLQLIDMLGFQVGEIKAANLQPDEEAALEEEKRRLANVEKLTTLSEDAFALLYDNAESASATLERSERKITELADYDAQFAAYLDAIATARAVVEDLSFAVRSFHSRLEFSPERLDEIELRLAEILRLKRKYGGTVEAVLDHLKTSEARLLAVETAEFGKEELRQKLDKAKERYRSAASRLSKTRKRAAAQFAAGVEESLKAVALERARFEVRIEHSDDEAAFSATGSDSVEFFFSANPGESPKPLARVASGGEASRLMLILKTVLNAEGHGKTAVFDEVDSGIGGRVAEAVGRKLKSLAASQQVLCVTHQPQIASLADRHFVVSKAVDANRTTVTVKQLAPAEQVEEIARMLAGENITEQARENARAMLAGK